MANPNTLREALAADTVQSLAPFDVQDLTVLDDLVSIVATPRPIGQLEAIEAWIKTSWENVGVQTLDAAGRVRFAEFFHRIGFLPKYKSYGTKYAAPFGYTLFDLENGGGFSIQLHETLKVEAFHVLAVQEKAFVLLCSRDEWEKHGPEMVELWEAGHPEDSILAYRPEPGDVTVVKDVSTIHTVLGCVLEEFATSSYDVVLRIHDQNEGRAIVLPAVHKSVASILETVPSLEPKHYVARDGDSWIRSDVPSDTYDIVSLRDKGLAGWHVIVSADKPVENVVGADNILTVFVLAGTLQLEVDGTSLTLSAGDVTALAPGSNYRFVSSDAHVSLCDVSLEIAFADLR